MSLHLRALADCPEREHPRGHAPEAVYPREYFREVVSYLWADTPEERAAALVEVE